ncbi:hypothetical protein [Dietzia sp. PP-33]|jgi:hypothetical protein|uniref:hypothetical protein n=1 Tax=Dietzia sp. PP-33 TaxID=2957500 RepID=UPI0029BAA6CE|nr:hypothetical protein [Dietzia sp. PP-33]MDX2358567.1 hypothetical protein [Dietzia sp. PP-33]
MTTSTPNTETTDDETFTERTLWRDALDALLSLVGRGQDVDPVELSETRARAEAEVEVETGRKSRHERKREQAAQDAAAARADDLAKGIDADFRAASEARIDAAWTAYLEVIEAEVETARAHNAEVSALARVCRDAGVPTVRPIDARTAEGDHVVVADGGRAWPTWRGVKYSPTAIEGEKLPHVADKSKRRQNLDQLRGRVY